MKTTKEILVMAKNLSLSLAAVLESPGVTLRTREDPETFIPKAEQLIRDFDVFTRAYDQKYPTKKSRKTK